MCTALSRWTPTADGSMTAPTGTCGFRRLRQAGLRIAPGAGCGSITTAGPGLAMIRGAGRLITTGDGIGARMVGAGGLARYLGVITGGPPWLASSGGAAEAASESDLDSVMWAGYLWPRLKRSIHGTGGAS